MTALVLLALALAALFVVSAIDSRRAATRAEDAAERSEEAAGVAQYAANIEARLRG